MCRANSASRAHRSSRNGSEGWFMFEFHCRDFPQRLVPGSAPQALHVKVHIDGKKHLVMKEAPGLRCTDARSSQSEPVRNLAQHVVGMRNISYECLCFVCQAGLPVPLFVCLPTAFDSMAVRLLTPDVKPHHATPHHTHTGKRPSQ